MATLESSRARQNFSKEAEDAINDQINVELDAAYAYQSIASWCSRDSVALLGFAKYYNKQAAEEREHAQKFINYMSLRGGCCKFRVIKEKPDDWKSALNILESALQMEKSVNDSLLRLHSTAEQHNDPALEDFLEGDFLRDQVEDIKTAADLITQLKRAGDEGLGLYLFDQQLHRMANDDS